jgi:Na+-transporting methylmalonyl-CoA/oxaloacetate decarboxylase gamma subunit
MDIGITLAVGLTVLIAVLIRSAMTLADISHSLEKIADRRQSPWPSDASPPASRALSEPEAKRVESDDAEIAAVIAVARAAMDGALPIAQ